MNKTIDFPGFKTEYLWDEATQASTIVLTAKNGEKMTLSSADLSSIKTHSEKLVNHNNDWIDEHRMNFLLQKRTDLIAIDKKTDLSANKDRTDNYTFRYHLAGIEPTLFGLPYFQWQPGSYNGYYPQDGFWNLKLAHTSISLDMKVKWDDEAFFNEILENVKMNPRYYIALAALKNSALTSRNKKEYEQYLGEKKAVIALPSARMPISPIVRALAELKLVSASRGGRNNANYTLTVGALNIHGATKPAVIVRYPYNTQDMNEARKAAEMAIQEKVKKALEDLGYTHLDRVAQDNRSTRIGFDLFTKIHIDTITPYKEILSNFAKEYAYSKQYLKSSTKVR
jgi:hypothetical protein